MLLKLKQFSAVSSVMWWLKYSLKIDHNLCSCLTRKCVYGKYLMIDRNVGRNAAKEGVKFEDALDTQF